MGFGSVRVADTLHGRVAGIQVADSAFKAFVDDSSGATRCSSDGSFLPTALTSGPDNTWWIINGDNGFGLCIR